MESHPPSWRVHSRTECVPDEPSIIVDPVLFQPTAARRDWTLAAFSTALVLLASVGVAVHVRDAAHSAPEPPPAAPVALPTQPALHVVVDRPAEVPEPPPPVQAALAPPVEKPPEVREVSFRDRMRQANRMRRRGRMKKAAALFEEALELRPKYPPALAGLARVHLKNNDSKEAAQWARLSVEQVPKAAGYHLLLGDALSQGGDQSAAEAEYREAERLGSEAAGERLLSAIPTNPF